VLGENLLRGLGAVQFCINISDANINDAISTTDPKTLDKDVSMVFVGPVGLESFQSIFGVLIGLDFSSAT
jgi:hypothetical protein